MIILTDGVNTLIGKQIRIGTNLTLSEDANGLPQLSAAASGGGGTVTGSGTAGRLAYWSTTTDLGNSVIRDNGTEVGIGGASVVGQVLRVYGAATVDSVLTVGGWALNMSGDGGSYRVGGDATPAISFAGSAVSAVNVAGSGTTIMARGGSVTLLRLLTDRVGIGTSTPNSGVLLHVAGHALFDNTVTANAFVGDGSGLTGLPSGFTEAQADAKYLQLTGGTVTGTMYFRGNVNVGPTTDNDAHLLFGNNSQAERYAQTLRASGQGYDFYFYRNNGAYDELMRFQWADGVVRFARTPTVAGTAVSLSTHNHDAQYAALGHSHPGMLTLGADAVYDEQNGPGLTVRRSFDTTPTLAGESHAFALQRADQASFLFLVDREGNVNGASFTGSGSGLTSIPNSALVGPFITGITAGVGISVGGSGNSTRSVTVNFAGTGTANTAARSDHTHSGTFLLTAPGFEQSIQSYGLTLLATAPTFAARASHSPAYTLTGLYENGSDPLSDQVSHAFTIRTVVTDASTAHFMLRHNGVDRFSVSQAGQVTAASFVGDGSQLTGLPSGFTQAQADARYLQLTGGTMTGAVTHRENLNLLRTTDADIHILYGNNNQAERYAQTLRSSAAGYDFYFYRNNGGYDELMRFQWNDGVVRFARTPTVAGTAVSLATHDHSGVYSPVGHNHDATYAPISHSHTGMLQVGVDAVYNEQNGPGITVRRSFDTTPTLAGESHAFALQRADQASFLFRVDREGNIYGAAVTATSFSGSGASLTSIPNSALNGPFVTNVTGGDGISVTGSGNASRTVAVSFGGSGSATTVARSDHTHAGQYILAAPASAQSITGYDLTMVAPTPNFTVRASESPSLSLLGYYENGTDPTSDLQGHTFELFTSPGSASTASLVIRHNGTNRVLINQAGTVTAAAFVGDGSGLTNLPSSGGITQAQGDARYLQLTGGTVTGTITLNTHGSIATSGSGVDFASSSSSYHLSFYIGGTLAARVDKDTRRLMVQEGLTLGSISSTDVRGLVQRLSCAETCNAGAILYIATGGADAGKVKLAYNNISGLPQTLWIALEAGTSGSTVRVAPLTGFFLNVSGVSSGAVMYLGASGGGQYTTSAPTSAGTVAIMLGQVGLDGAQQVLCFNPTYLYEN